MQTRRCTTNHITVCVPNKSLSQSVVPIEDVDIKANRDEQLCLVSQSGVRSLGPTEDRQTNENNSSTKE